MECIELRNLTRTYLDARGEVFYALNHVSLLWEQGQSIAVMGESGSGKSTLARLMAGLERPSGGSVYINGEDTSSWKFSRWKRCRASVQAVFQDAGGTLNPAWTTLRNMEEALCNFTNLSSRDRREKIIDLMGKTGLRKELLKVPVTKLSGGEQRRLALLRSLSIHPRFLILDEVTAGLDLISTQMVMELLEQYQKEYDCSYLIVTHDLQTASRLCKTIYEIEHGQITRKAVRQ